MLTLVTVMAGPPSAPGFDEVRQLYGAAVHRFCLVMLGEPRLAEDAARRVLELADGAYPSDRPEPSAIAPWLMGIACGVAGETRRRRRPPRRREADVSELDGALAAAARLPEREVTAAALRGAVGLGYAEIGGLLGTSPEGARMSCGWALRRIRDGAGRTG